MSKGWDGYHDGVELTGASNMQGVCCRANLRIGKGRRRNVTSIGCLLDGYQKLAKKRTLASVRYPELRRWYKFYIRPMVRGSKTIQDVLHQDYELVLTDTFVR